MQMFRSSGDTLLCISALVTFALGVSALPVEEGQIPDPVVSLMTQISQNEHWGLVTTPSGGERTLLSGHTHTHTHLVRPYAHTELRPRSEGRAAPTTLCSAVQVTNASARILCTRISTLTLHGPTSATLTLHLTTGAHGTGAHTCLAYSAVSLPGATSLARQGQAPVAQIHRHVPHQVHDCTRWQLGGRYYRCC